MKLAQTASDATATLWLYSDVACDVDAVAVAWNDAAAAGADVAVATSEGRPSVGRRTANAVSFRRQSHAAMMMTTATLTAMVDCADR